VPTFADYLKACVLNNVVPIIEIKQQQMAAADYDSLLQTMAYYGVTTNCYVISFYAANLQELARRNPEIPMMYLTGYVDDSIIAEAKLMGNHAGIDADYEALTPANIIQMHANNLVVGAWTLLDSQVPMMKQMGVDVVTVNRGETE
jgi:glycerophosphoryl diester phosphodiesterase